MNTFERYYGFDVDDLMEAQLFEHGSQAHGVRLDNLNEHRGGSLTMSRCSNNDDIIYHQLFEHRGKPDPKLARERQEAHKRGLERHKHALEVEKEEQARKREREKEKKLVPERKKELLAKVQKIQQRKQGQQKQQETQDTQYQQVPNQQQKQQVTDLKTDEKELKRQKEITSKNSKEYALTIKHLDKIAPTNNTKQIVKDTNKEIVAYHKKYTSWLDKLTPRERKQEIQKMKDEYNTKFQKIKEDKLSKCETKEEKEWVKKHFGVIGKSVGNLVSGVSDLMGYKAVFDDISGAITFLFGGGGGKN